MLEGRSEVAAAARLTDAAALWRLQPYLVQDVIDAAVDCLVADVDSPALRVLAGADPRESRWVLDPLIADTLEELGFAEVMTVRPQRAALTVMVRRFKAGEVGARDLASWAHTNISHDGDASCDPFVSLDDAYDLADYTGRDLSELEEWAHEEADAFLAGIPSPNAVTLDSLQPPAAAAAPRTWGRRLLSWVRRQGQS